MRKVDSSGSRARLPTTGALKAVAALIGVGGTAATGALLWMLAGAGAPSEHVSWFTVVLLACATAATVGCCLLGALALDIDASKKKTSHSLLRQRRLMLSRTKALRESRRRYRDLFHNVPAAVLMSDPSGAIVAANPAMLELLGIDSEHELRDANFRDFYAEPSERDRLVRAWHAGSDDIWRGELKLRRRDGGEINVLCTARLLRDEQGRVVFKQGMYSDVTALRRAEGERRTLETHLRMSQKLESVGRLAAGVAHEINSPMQVLGDNVHFLSRTFESLRDLLAAERRMLSEQLGEDTACVLAELRRIEEHAELEYLLETTPGALRRASDSIHAVSRIVTALTELAHPSQGVRSRVDINALVNTALVITRNEYKTLAEVETSFDDLPALLVQKNELCQVLINLIVNAAHAIESAQRQDGRHGLIRIVTRGDGDAAAIRVTDNGCGIPEAALDKVFDPFFTTKEVGRGTGQGLAIARTMVVDKHDGDIHVDSTPGTGTTFTIRLPIGQSTHESELPRSGANGR